MKNLSIRTKLIMMVVPTALVAIAAVIYYSIFTIDAVNKSERIFYEELYRASDLVLEADRDFQQVAVAEKNYAFRRYITFTKEQIDSFYNDFVENRDQIIERMGEVEKMAKEYPDIGNYSKDGKSVNDLLKTFNEQFKLWDESYDLKASKGDSGKRLKYFESTREPIDQITELMENYAKEESLALKNTAYRNVIIVSIVIAVIFVIVTVFVVYVIRYIRKNTVYVTNKMNSLAKKDLTDTINIINSRDEIGQLSKAAYDVRGQMIEMVETLRSSSNNLLASSSQMEENTEESAQSMENIDRAATELANTATQQASDVEQIAGQIVDISNIMERSIDSTNSLSSVSEQIQEVTDSGMNAVEHLTNITEQSVEAFENIFSVIDGIGDSTKRISEASDLISSVAEQTNLLSLNASIEAARAGEAGRGFAVVAEEIRELSEQSAKSVDTINQMLSDLQKNTDAATAQSDLVREIVDKQKESVDETKDRFGEIVQSMESVNSGVAELESVNESLGKGVDNIRDLISNLSAASEENAATAEQLNATTNIVTGNVSSLQQTGESVNDSSKELSSIINAFRVGDSDGYVDVPVQQEQADSDIEL